MVVGSARVAVHGVTSAARAGVLTGAGLGRGVRGAVSQAAARDRCRRTCWWGSTRHLIYLFGTSLEPCGGLLRRGLRGDRMGEGGGGGAMGTCGMCVLWRVVGGGVWWMDGQENCQENRQHNGQEHGQERREILI